MQIKKEKIVSLLEDSISVKRKIVASGIDSVYKAVEIIINALKTGGKVFEISFSKFVR